MQEVLQMTEPTTLEGDGRPTLRVVVAGDTTIELNLALDAPTKGDVVTADTTSAPHRGGAALLADLISLVAADDDGPDVQVASDPPPGAELTITDPRYHHAYATWTRFPEATDDPASRRQAWRARSLLGVDRASDAEAKTHWTWLRTVLPQADVVVIDDAALGFRDLSSADLWGSTDTDRRPWIVLQQAGPVLEGPLWEHLTASAGARTVLVLTIDDLRGQEVRVSRALSWERTAQDLLWEVIHKPRVSALAQIAHTVVSFGAAGAALISARADSAIPACTLYFDPDLVEGGWAANHPGEVPGATRALTAALTREILLDPARPDLGHGVQAGVAAGRVLSLHGYDRRGPDRMALGFPLTAVAAEVRAGRQLLGQVDVTDPATDDRYWTILEDTCTGDLTTLAADIARDGVERALTGVPIGRFGHLVTVDRGEIEAFRTVASLISEYVRTPQPKPLSIGVFGPPGAGKSFGVKEVARAGGLVDKPLEFNLAQFRSPDDLIDALHVVRDKVLGGAVPLVFWDEFDTALDGNPLGWLRYFLAPMQDGEFRQGQITHPIGRCIFVFAGGTCSRIEDFSEAARSAPGRQAKGPDFVSRLQGFVNVIGPNRQTPADAFHVVRRAILVRSILGRSAPALFAEGRLSIDDGVLRALLETMDYHHGTRSLEAVIATSRLSGQTSFERSSLPPEPQLQLHVDAQDFLALVQRPDLDGDLLERLARAAHEVYCDGLRARNYTYAATSDDSRRASDALIPFDELPAVKQEQNRRTVRGIPAKLALIGCVMVPARADLVQAEFTDDELDVLARAEHEQWLAQLGSGWRYGKYTDLERRVHRSYRAWEELSQADKAKDVDLVRRIPLMLGKAGYIAVRLSSPRS